MKRAHLIALVSVLLVAAAAAYYYLRVYKPAASDTATTPQSVDTPVKAVVPASENGKGSSPQGIAAGEFDHAAAPTGSTPFVSTSGLVGAASALNSTAALSE